MLLLCADHLMEPTWVVGGEVGPSLGTKGKEAELVVA
jgi:hypothetical protein